MPDIERKELTDPDDFQKRLLNCEDPDMVSPKMSEYIDMMEAYLLVREKQVFENTSFTDAPLS